MARIYNLKRQKPDEKDYSLKVLLDVHPQVKLPKVVDISTKCPPIYDQLNLGSCTANAGTSYRIFLTGNLTLQLSRLFQYYNERKIEGDINQDGGAQMRDIGKAMLMYGICLENLYPYDISKFANTPSSQAYTEALTYKIKSYTSVPDLNGIKQVLALKQQPVLIGIDVYSSFESDKVTKTGIVPLPKKGEQLLGGHAIYVCGYDDIKKKVKFANSWGTSWGDKGFGYLPYTYFSKGYAYDFWILQN